MRIVSWNCGGAFRKKLAFVDELGADVLVILECEDPARSTSTYRNWAEDYLWIGDNKNKGVGVFPRKNNVVESLDWDRQKTFIFGNVISPALTWRTSDLQHFLPCRVNRQFLLVAVWTKSSSAPFDYIGQFWKFLQLHETDLRIGEATIICGDFNSNAIWDKPDRWWNHTDVVAQLEQLNIWSLYHHQTGQKPGAETQGTFFMYRKLSRPYHIDYAFLSGRLLDSSRLTLGNSAEWLSISDHIPLIIDLFNDDPANTHLKD